MPSSEPIDPGYQRGGRKPAFLHRLSRIEGQVRGIRRMVEEGRYCVEILTQIEAVTAALSRVQERILEDHINHCVGDALKDSDVRARREKVDEVVSLLRSFRRAR